MIEPLSGMPDGVIGFEAVGEVHADDYKTVLEPAIDAAAQADGVRLVYVLGDRFEGYSAGASLQDAKLGIEHVRAWKRAAIVTDVDWVTHLIAVFGWLVPGHLRHFPLAEQADAVSWVGSD